MSKGEVAGNVPPKIPGGAAGDSSNDQRQRRPSRASTIPIRGGKREIKSYALTEHELTSLGVIQGGSALFFSIAGACLGFWLNIKQQISFSDEQTPKQVIAYWQGLQEAACLVGLITGIIGAGLFLFSGWTIFGIKRNTTHD